MEVSNGDDGGEVGVGSDRGRDALATTAVAVCVQVTEVTPEVTVVETLWLLPLLLIGSVGGRPVEVSGGGGKLR